jgi:hypothetical protein
MSADIAGLLRGLSAAQANESFIVRRLAARSRYFVGRDASGCAALLVQSSGQGRGVPLRLAGIEARFAVDCKIAEPDLPATTETLTLVLCLSRDPSVEAYFAGILQSLISVLGPEPTTEEINDAVDQLVALFQRLQQPGRRSLTGLVGELCVILFAADANAAISAWRVDPNERFDFVAGKLRLDVKATSTGRRAHEITFEQANAPEGAQGLFASIWVETVGGGTTLSGLLAAIETRLGRQSRSVSKLRNVVAETLGNALPAALDSRFDLQLARSSLLLYEAAAVPAIRPTLPFGVSGLRFISDFGRCAPIGTDLLREALGAVEASLLPL